jgi:alkylation response protein AidB-like acyl-CoA dehydrogenase
MAAVDDGDDLVCTGSKIWTTHAREANWMFGLVRTSRGAKKQQGITFVLIDMTSPGIEIRPLVMTSGEEVQNQVFFDEVRVPKSNVLGQIDDGWTVAKYLLEFERGGGAASPALQVMAEEIATVAADQPAPGGGRLIDDPAFARKLADCRIRTEVLEILEYRVLAALAGGGHPGAASSMLKVVATELSQALTNWRWKPPDRADASTSHTRHGREGQCPNSSHRRTVTSAATSGRRSHHCATSTTGPARSTPAATRFSETFSPRRLWGYRWTSI